MEDCSFQAPSSKYPPNDNSQLQPFCEFCGQTRSTVEGAFYHTCASNPTVSRAIPHPTLIVPINGKYETDRSYVQCEYPQINPPQNQNIHNTYTWGPSQFMQSFPAYGMPDRVVGDSFRHQFQPAYPQEIHRAPGPIQVVVPNMPNTFSPPMNSPGYATSVTTEFPGTPRSCCSSDPPNTFEKERHDSGIILSSQDTTARTRLPKRKQLQQNEERGSFPQVNDEELERRRERNREASKKSRNKKKELISYLSKQVLDLEVRNKKLEEIKGELKAKNSQLENLNKALHNERDGLHKKTPNDNSQLQSFRGFCDSFNCQRTEQTRPTVEGAFYHTYASNPTVSRAIPHPTLIVPMNCEYETYRSNVQYEYPKVYLSQNQYTYSWGSSQFVKPYPVYGMPYRVVGDSCRHQCQLVYPQDMHRAPDPIQVVVPNISNTFSTPMNSPEYATSVTTEFPETHSCCSSEPPNTFEKDMIEESFYPDKITTPSPVMPQKWEGAKDGKNQNEERESFPQANDEEIERRRKRNREASKKSRNKKKQIISDLSRQVQDLEAYNKKLEEIKGKLKARNFKLENWNKVLTNELDGLHEKPPNDNSQLQPFCGFCEQTRSTVEEAFYHTCSSNPTVSRVIPHPTLIVPMNGEYETYRSYVQYEYPKVYPPQNQYTYSWGSSQFVQHYPAYGMPDRVVGDSCRHQYPPAYPQDMHRAPDPIQVVVPNMSNTFSTPMNSPGYATSVTTEFSGTPSSCCSSDPPNTFEKERHDSGIILSRQDTIAQTRLAKRRQLQQNEERESFPQANDEEIERRRKRNRDASTKSRNKRKQIISDLSRQVQDLETRNKKLEEIKGELKERNFKFENWNKVLTNELDGLHEKVGQIYRYCHANNFKLPNF